MKHLLQAEAIASFIVSVVLLNMLPFQFAWWAWILIFLAPDVSMIGYLVNNRVGAWVYNVFHHQLVAVAVWCIGVAAGWPTVAFVGLVLLGHSGLDRFLGYGLKREEGFKFTHLGPVGK